ncbi:MAG: hypothetical protein FWG68_06050 [Defluviitaleaceae bacterium]|nr:hypothetical protein [Defluviitaleaceae bacterium]
MGNRSWQKPLNTFLDENIQGFILGDWENIAGQWDSFVQQAIAMDANDLLAAYQSAFDRFLAN